jgi:hypothetical protein
MLNWGESAVILSQKPFLIVYFLSKLIINRMESRKLKDLIYKVEFWLHLILWSLFFASINVKWTESWISDSFLPESVAPHLALAVPIIFLSNVFWLIPTFLNKRKWYLYIALTFTLLVGFEILRSVIFSVYLSEADISYPLFKEEFFGENSLIFGDLSVLIFTAILYSFLYKFARDWIFNQSIISQLKLENNNLQLSLVSSANVEKFNILTEPKEVFSIKKRDGFFLLRIENIKYFQANGDFVIAIDNEGRKHIINERLRTINNQLDKKVFFQISRSEIVNFNFIEKYTPYIKNRLEIFLKKSQESLFTSNSRTPEFRSWIENH